MIPKDFLYEPRKRQKSSHLWLIILFAVIGAIFILWPHSSVSESISGVNVPERPSLKDLQAVRGQKSPITAYSELDSCHYPNCAMASGRRAYRGSAACPRNVPLGTKIYIEGEGYFTCEDRTAAHLDGRYDIFMGYGQYAYEQAIKFGIKQREVTFIE